MSTARTFLLDDQGDGYEVALFENGEQVGSTIFPDTENRDTFALAVAIGQAWERITL